MVFLVRLHSFNSHRVQRIGKIGSIIGIACTVLLTALSFVVDSAVPVTTCSTASASASTSLIQHVLINQGILISTQFSIAHYAGKLSLKGHTIWDARSLAVALGYLFSVFSVLCFPWSFLTNLGTCISVSPIASVVVILALIIHTIVSLDFVFIMGLVAALKYLGAAARHTPAFSARQAADKGIDMITSENTPLPLDVIAMSQCVMAQTQDLEEQQGIEMFPKSAGIAMSYAPGRQKGRFKRDLLMDVSRIKQIGVDVIVTLLPQREMEAVKNDQLFALCRESDIQCVHFPWGDKFVPGGVDDFFILIRTLVIFIRAGKLVLVHCNGGVGRTGLVATTLVGTMFGMSFEQSVGIVRETRRPDMLRNPLQQWYCKSFLESAGPVIRKEMNLL